MGTKERYEVPSRREFLKGMGAAGAGLAAASVGVGAGAAAPAVEAASVPADVGAGGYSGHGGAPASQCRVWAIVPVAAAVRRSH